MPALIARPVVARKMSTLYLLFESSSGYGLFERVKAEVIEVNAVQQDINDLKKFSELVKLKCQPRSTHRAPCSSRCRPPAAPVSYQ